MVVQSTKNIYMNGTITDLMNIFDAVNPNNPERWYRVSVKDVGRPIDDILSEWVKYHKTHYYLHGVKTTFELR